MLVAAGVVSILLHVAPHQFPGLSYVAVVFYALNVFLFLSFLGISVARYTMFPCEALHQSSVAIAARTAVTAHGSNVHPRAQGCSPACCGIPPYACSWVSFPLRTAHLSFHTQETEQAELPLPQEPSPWRCAPSSTPRR